MSQDIAPPVTVQLVDAGGNPVATSGVSVTLALGSNPGSGTLSGTLTEPTNASGVATFNDLSINEPGFGYTLTASSTGLTARPQPVQREQQHRDRAPAIRALPI